ncbi:MAG: hypothetical protein F9K40_02950 [Kofleriaceae bacterium]|nr:MAG: hypothetical protein F9K40_02950 [Kofleriaceae bacterium]MBZ0233033.1 hypothetical protein [Kofleriaceae bacterium]
MSAVARRVRAERDLWKAVWKQMEAFLDRVDGAADQDEPHAQTLCQLLPVLNVIENARHRAFGVRLEAARPATLRGVGLTTSAGALKPGQIRLPGLEECELATAPLHMPDDSTTQVILWPSESLATFRDARRHLEGTKIVPAYENGFITGYEPLDDAADEGLFPFDNREDAAKGDDVAYVSWSVLRQNKVDDLPVATGAARPLSTQLDELTLSDPLDEYRAIGALAEGAAAACITDKNTLATARAELEEVGADAELIGALSAVEAELAGQAEDYQWVADRLENPTYAQLNQEKEQIEDRLREADYVGGLPGFSLKMSDLDARASDAFDAACEARITYPDGPLRQLRLLEQGLRFYWRMRSRWMERRFSLITFPVVYPLWSVYVDGLDDVIEGRPSQLVLPAGTVTTMSVNARATKVYVTGIPLPAGFRPGRLAMIDGPRPAAMVVTDEGFDKFGLFMMTTPVELSLDTDEALPGVPGVIDPGAAVEARFPTFTTSEWRRGVANDASRTALLTGLIAHASRLKLLLGGGVAGDRPAARAVPDPYPGVTSWAIEGPVAPEAARLFLSAVPSASASGTGERLGVGRPGELMLVRGRDEEGFTWQGVAEIDHCEILSGDAAKADAEITGTPVPPCCEDQTEVMVVYLRALEIPATLVADLTLRRDFLGFGTRSLLSGTILPASLDAATTVPTVTVDGESRLVLRDRELETALRWFEDWLGRDIGNAS